MTTNFPPCENGRVTLSTDNQGRDWEHFWVGNDYKFSNQIPNRQSFSTTNPGWILRDRGLCAWAGDPPPRQGVATSTMPTQPLTTAGENLPPQVGPSGGVGLLIVLGLIGAGVWAYYHRGGDDYTDDYHPMSDVPDYPPLYTEADPPSQGNSPHGIPEVEPDEFTGNSSEFERNSPIEENSQNHGIPTDSADSPQWPPKTMGAPFDPLQPEQPEEFDLYRKLVDQNGVNPKGNDIIKLMWGCKPGRGSAYQSARTRRDEFAKRLDYYRYEGA